MKSSPLFLSIQITFDGDHTLTVPESLKKRFNKKDSGREGDATNFIFTKEIKEEDDAAAMEG